MILDLSAIFKRAFTRTNLQSVLLLLLVVLFFSIIILASVPPVSRDALAHHLIVPKLYLQHGSIYEIPSTVFSYYPMNLDLLYMIPLYFGNDIAPKFIHFIFALLTAWLIFSYLRKRLDKSWALVGGLFFLSLPIIVKLSITVYVDLGLIFFSTAAILSLLKWIESRYQIKFLILSAACCGLALGTKYNGLIVLFILTVFIPFVFISNSKKNLNLKKPEDIESSLQIQFKAFGFGAIFLIVALLVFSPWMIRNYVWKANPIYPLYNNVFNRQIPVSPDAQTDNQTLGPDAGPQQTSKAKSTRWSPFAIRKVIHGESWWEIALIPVRIFFQGQDDNPKYFDGKLHPFLFLLPFFAFIHLKKNPAILRTEKKIFVFFTILFLLYAFSSTSIRIRYVAPIIPPLVILAVLGLHQIARLVTNRKVTRPAWIGSGFIIFMVTGIIALNASYILKQFHYVDPFSYISGRVSRDTYIAKYRPEHSIYQYVNRTLPDNVKILGLFLGNRRYYSDRELFFGVDKFKKIIDRVDSTKILINDLRESGFTHLIIRFDLFNQWTSKQFGDSKKQMLKIFFDSHVRHILSKDGYGLFELRNIQ
jgi:4-amino-4-deoxy-L-arabinose transferase-like glycosyltransferase